MSDWAGAVATATSGAIHRAIMTAASESYYAIARAVWADAHNAVSRACPADIDIHKLAHRSGRKGSP